MVRYVTTKLQRIRFSRQSAGWFIILAMVAVGVSLLMLTRAATLPVVLQAESAVIANGAVVVNASGMSSNAALRFGKGIAFGGASPGGTYGDWYFEGSGLSSFEWTQRIVADPPATLTSDGLLHYYAYTFGVTNHNSDVGGGYAGFQTNALYQGVFRGKGINFAFWRSNGGVTSAPGLLEAGNAESGGYRIVYPYSWIVGRSYRFELMPGPSGTDSQGKWWGLWITDQTTSTKTFVGELRVQTSINGLSSSLLHPKTGGFGEDLNWWRSLYGTTKYNCSDFQASSQATMNVSANGGAVKPNYFTAHTNSLDPSEGTNGYKTTNCPVSVYSNSKGDVQMNLGYWNPGAPDVVSGN